MRKNIFTIFLAMLFIIPNCLAQGEATLPQTPEDTFWSNVKNDFISPFNNLTGKKVLLGGLGLATGLVLTREVTSYPLQEETAKKRPMGSSSKYGDMAGQMYPSILYFVGMEAYSYFADNPEAHEFAIVMLKSTIYASLVTDVLKKTVQEPRPSDPSDKESFPSAHATRAFAFAATVNELHGSSWGIPAYIMSTGVAYSRMNDNRHYVHDVLAGAAIGASYGISIAQRYKNKKENQKSNSEFAVIPTGDGAAATFSYSF
ncbi:MAG: phosphatase PAP2 family protein [Bdellovibrionota bacterium]